MMPITASSSISVNALRIVFTPTLQFDFHRIRTEVVDDLKTNEAPALGFLIAECHLIEINTVLGVPTHHLGKLVAVRLRAACRAGVADEQAGGVDQHRLLAAAAESLAHHFLKDLVGLRSVELVGVLAVGTGAFDYRHLPWNRTIPF